MGFYKTKILEKHEKTFSTPPTSAVPSRTLLLDLERCLSYFSSQNQRTYPGPLSVNDADAHFWVLDCLESKLGDSEGENTSSN